MNKEKAVARFPFGCRNIKLVMQKSPIEDFYYSVKSKHESTIGLKLFFDRYQDQIGECGTIFTRKILSL